jgi:predicted nucleic-acid-binding protein
MIAVDTNILARAIAEEADADAATLRQQRQARALLSSGQPLFVPVTVVVELEWVLRGAYGMAAADIAAVLEDLLAVEGLNVDRAAALAQALQGYRAGLDLADALHLRHPLCQDGAPAGLDSPRAGAAGLRRRSSPPWSVSGRCDASSGDAGPMPWPRRR